MPSKKKKESSYQIYITTFKTVKNVEKAIQKILKMSVEEEQMN